MAQDREQYRKWINGLKLKGMGAIYRRDRGTELKTLKRSVEELEKWLEAGLPG
jgi:hypothetical protein